MKFTTKTQLAMKKLRSQVYRMKHFRHRYNFFIQLYQNDIKWASTEITLILFFFESIVFEYEETD